jgi:D-alanyl-D-alanine dipeptidase
MWQTTRDSRYVADPAVGSNHSRGAAVDLTLVTKDGVELEMPSGFDEFSERAHRDFTCLAPGVAANRGLLESAMRQQGFVPLPTEWWHFDDAEWRRYGVLDVPL